MFELGGLSNLTMVTGIAAATARAVPFILHLECITPEARSVVHQTKVSPEGARRRATGARRCPVRAAKQLQRTAALRAQRPEPHAKGLGQQLGLLPCGEVTASVVLLVVDQLRIRTLRPAARGWIEFVREDAHGN